MTKKEKEIILEHLAKEEPYRLNHDIKLAPEWVRKIIREALKKENDE